MLNGVTLNADTTLVTNTSVTSLTTIAAGGFIGSGSIITGNGLAADGSGAALTQDNKSAYTGRFTQIGHGGIGIGRNDIGGYNTGLAIFATSYNNPGSGSRDNLDNGGVADADLRGGALVTTNRAITGLNLIGNVSVKALKGAVRQMAGNHFLDYSMIGHGGGELADMESSNIALGDVTVWALTDVSIRGSDQEYTSNSTTVTPFRSFAKVGHGGDPGQLRLQGRRYQGDGGHGGSHHDCRTVAGAVCPDRTFRDQFLRSGWGKCDPEGDF